MPRIIKEVIYGQFLPLIAASARGRSEINIHELNKAVTMDLVTAFLLGLPSYAGFLEGKADRKSWLSSYQKRKKYGFWQQEMPHWLGLLKSVGIPVVPKWVFSANAEVERLCVDMCESAESRFQGGHAQEDEAPVYRRLSQAIKQQERAGTDSTKFKEVASEMLDHLGKNACVPLEFLRLGI